MRAVVVFFVAVVIVAALSSYGALRWAHRSEFSPADSHDWLRKEDVEQETFVRVYFKAAKYAPKSTVKTWIYAIALNLCRDQFRQLARHRRDVSMDAPPRDDAARPELAEAAPPPSTRVADADRFVHLQHAIDRLPEKLREALLLFSLEQRSQQEVAEILAITPKAVETRVYHAKEKLRQLLADKLGEAAATGRSQRAGAAALPLRGA